MNETWTVRLNGKHGPEVSCEHSVRKYRQKTTVKDMAEFPPELFRGGVLIKKMELLKNGKICAMRRLTPTPIYLDSWSTMTVSWCLAVVRIMQKSTTTG